MIPNAEALERRAAVDKIENFIVNIIMIVVRETVDRKGDFRFEIDSKD